MSDTPEGPVDVAGIHGHVVIELRNSEGELIHREEVENLITQVGDQMYGERGAGIGTLAAPTGMRLGSGSTAVAKTGAGAAIVTYITGSSIAVGTPTSGLNGASRRMTYVTAWAAGVATAASITEIVITNESPLTNVAGTAANTISRVVVTAFAKAAGDSLTVTWTHDLLGA